MTYSALLLEEATPRGPVKSRALTLLRKLKDLAKGGVRRVIGRGVVKAGIGYITGERGEIGSAAAEAAAVAGVGKLIDKAMDAAIHVVARTPADKITVVDPAASTQLSIPAGAVKLEAELLEQEDEEMGVPEIRAGGSFWSRIVSLFKSLLSGGVLRVLLFCVGLIVFFAFVLGVVSETVSTWLESQLTKFAQGAQNALADLAKRQEEAAKAAGKESPGEYRRGFVSPLKLIFDQTRKLLEFIRVRMRLMREAFQRFVDENREKEGYEGFFGKVKLYAVAYWRAIKTFFVGLKGKEGAEGPASIGDFLRLLLAPIILALYIFGRGVKGLFSGLVLRSSLGDEKKTKA